jgi:hypothetical protein
MDEPTTYSDLNAVLCELGAGARAILAANFCGAYLVGSFAIGGADEHSDVDFIVVTNGELDGGQVAALGALHARLHALAVPWAKHLEGSYVSKALLRHVDPSRTPLLYLDNGASELIWDDHCNTAVLRWSLREHGITLAGPGPRTLVDPVSAEQLRAEVLMRLHEYVAWAKSPGMSRWRQPYLVLTCCRMLHTLRSGTVVPKQEAGAWALDALDSRWSPLIQRALDDRPDPWLRVQEAADPAAADSTLAFVDFAVEEAASIRRS